MPLYQTQWKESVGSQNPKTSKPKIQNFLKGHHRSREFTKPLISARNSKIIAKIWTIRKVLQGICRASAVLKRCEEMLSRLHKTPKINVESKHSGVYMVLNNAIMHLGNDFPEGLIYIWKFQLRFLSFSPLFFGTELFSFPLWNNSAGQCSSPGISFPIRL